MLRNSTETWFEFMKRTRKRNSRGAALVEAAIVMLPLCLIIFGIIEFGFIYKDSLAVSNSSRSGARIGSAEGTSPTFYSDIVTAVQTAGTGAAFQNGDKMCIYQVNNTVNSNGTPVGGATGCGNGRLFTWNSGSQSFTGNTADSGSWTSATRQSCLSSSNIDSVGVMVQVSHKSITGFFGSLTLTEHTVMRLEPPASDSAC